MFGENDAHQWVKTFIDQCRTGKLAELRFCCEKGHLKVTMSADLGPVVHNDVHLSGWTGVQSGSPSRLRRRERRAAERAAAGYAAAEKVAAAEKAATSRVNAEKAAAEKCAIEKAAAEKYAAEKAAAERGAAKKAAAENNTAEKAGAEKCAAELKGAAEKAAAEKYAAEVAAAAEKWATGKAAAEKYAAKKASVENSYAEKAAAAKAATKKVAEEKDPAKKVVEEVSVATTSFMHRKVQCSNCNGCMTPDHQCELPASVVLEHPPPIPHCPASESAVAGSKCPSSMVEVSGNVGKSVVSEVSLPRLPLCHYCCHLGSGNNPVHYVLQCLCEDKGCSCQCYCSEEQLAHKKKFFPGGFSGSLVPVSPGDRPRARAMAEARANKLDYRGVPMVSRPCDNENCLL